jgi:hypothetical protein
VHAAILSFNFQSDLIVQSTEIITPTDVTAIGEQIVYKIREPRRLRALWASTACYIDTFTLPHISFIESICLDAD